MFSWFLVKTIILLDQWKKRAKIKAYKYVIEKKAKIGKNFKLGYNSVIVCPEKMQAGDNLSIGENTMINAEGGIEIGSNVYISSFCVFFTKSHSKENIHRITYKKIKIGDNVLIGAGAKIRPGAVIPTGTLVKMGETFPPPIL